MNFLKDLIDRTTNSSAMRFCLVFAFLFVTITPFTVWATICLKNSKIEDLPTGIITLALGILGIVVAGKAKEKGDEAKNGSTS